MYLHHCDKYELRFLKYIYTCSVSNYNYSLCMIKLTVTEIRITNKAMAYLPHGQLPFHMTIIIIVLCHTL